MSWLSTLAKDGVKPVIRSIEDMIAHDLVVRAPRPRIKPKIARDNPGGDWLESQRRRAKENSPHISGAVTAYTRRPIELDPRKIRHLPGANGERPVPGTPKYDRLLEQVKHSGGIHEDSPILIGVNHDGKPYILDGNNRTAVADDLGIRAVPAEVRYFAGGEQHADDWAPDQLEKYMAPSELMSSPRFRKWFGDGALKDEYGEPIPLYHGTNKDFSSFLRPPEDVGIHMGTLGQAEDRASASSHRWSRAGGGGNTPHIMPVYTNMQNPYPVADVGNFDLDNLSTQLDNHRMTDVADVHDFLGEHGYDGIVYRNTGETAGAEPYRNATDAAYEKWHELLKKYSREDDGIQYGHDTISIAPDINVRYPDLLEANKEYALKAALYKKFRDENIENSYAAFYPTQIKSRFNRGTFDPYDPDILKARGGLIR